MIGRLCQELRSLNRMLHLLRRWCLPYLLRFRLYPPVSDTQLLGLEEL